MQGYIDDIAVEYAANETILEVACRYNIYIPTLCALPDISHTPGTCRVCLVETTDLLGKVCLVSACTEKMSAHKVATKTQTLRDARRLQVELILADHNQNCAACSRHGDCELMDVSVAVGVTESTIIPSGMAKQRKLDQHSNGIVRDMSKCIRCMRCRAVCEAIQGVDALEFVGQGEDAQMQLRTLLPQGGDACINCGQCTLVCPTGAISVVNDSERVLDWLNDPKITTVVQFAPAVRVSIGEEFGVAAGVNCEGQVISALKKLGADIVVDTNFSADLVIIEEGYEFLRRFKEQDHLPMFTSCCPGWVNYLEKNQPELLAHLSSTKSPQQCLGAIAKTYLSQRLTIPPEQIRTISIMPCTAKKDECQRPQTIQDFGKEIDAVLTTRELVQLLRRNRIDFINLAATPYTDPLMGEYTGAAVIFGKTGGVMEAAIRSVYKVLTGEELHAIAFTPVSGHSNIREATVTLADGTKVRAAVCQGVNAARELIKDIEKGVSGYDFIEVMACPQGCISGGGQPRKKGHYQTNSDARSNGLKAIDQCKAVRQSHNNQQVKQLYTRFLGQPNSPLAHKLLHTTYRGRNK